MVKIIVIDRKKKKHLLDIKEGETIRDAIEQQITPENFGICGGTCTCATCHLYIDSKDFDRIEAKKKDEINTLETRGYKPENNSRLACQIVVKPEYENIEVNIAEDSFDNLFE
tara:strand:+ start:195 stop:533 length:339 start_codon:yes stop_codon:yes gene_type:complete